MSVEEQKHNDVDSEHSTTEEQQESGEVEEEVHISESTPVLLSEDTNEIEGVANEPTNEPKDEGEKVIVGETEVEETEQENEDEAEEEDEETEDDLEAKAIAEAMAAADASYSPPASIINSASPYPLIRSVDGMSLSKYNPAPSVFTARAVPVPLRGKLNVPIHVTIGGSVIEYTVESKDFDIGFGVVAEREEGVTVVAPKARVESHMKAVSGKFLVGSVPCALIFTFDNEYSWFREKRITYQITVKPPTKENIISGRKHRANIALKIVSDDKTSAEERLDSVSEKRQELIQEVDRLEKELEEKKKSLSVAEKEEGWLKNRVQLRSIQEDLLNRRLIQGWEDEEVQIEESNPSKLVEI